MFDAILVFEETMTIDDLVAMLNKPTPEQREILGEVLEEQLNNGGFGEFPLALSVAFARAIPILKDGRIPTARDLASNRTMH